MALEPLKVGDVIPIRHPAKATVIEIVEHPDDEAGTYILRAEDGTLFLMQHNQAGYDATVIELSRLRRWLEVDTPAPTLEVRCPICDYSIGCRHCARIAAEDASVCQSVAEEK